MSDYDYSNPHDMYALGRADMAKNVDRLHEILRMLERRGVITTDLAEAAMCCGIERDADGFCQHRPHHPIYVQPNGD